VEQGEGVSEEEGEAGHRVDIGGFSPSGRGGIPPSLPRPVMGYAGRDLRSSSEKA
jgi:hypothetical protein